MEDGQEDFQNRATGVAEAVKAMQCPHCNLGLIPRRESGGKAVSFVCKKCSGQAIDAAGVHQMLDKKLDQWLWELAKDSAPSLETRCPQCQSFMRTSVLEGGSGAVEVNACTSCHFVWFENGQIQELLQESDLLQKERAAGRDSSKFLEVRSWREDPNGFFLSFLALPFPQEGVKWNEVVVWICLTLIVTGAFSFQHLQWALEHLAFIPDQALRRPTTWLSSFFVHINWAHLLGNLYFFFILGAGVEEVLGADGLILLLVVSTLMGNLAAFVLESRRSIPQVGASAGITGVMAYFALKFPNKRLSVLRSGFRNLLKFQIPVWAFVLGFLIKEVLGYKLGSQDGVSHLSHLGGAVGGLAWFIFS